MDSSIRANLLIDKVVPMGGQIIQKISGSGAGYVESVIGQVAGEKDNVYATIEKCSNCAVCLSFERHLVLDAGNYT